MSLGFEPGYLTEPLTGRRWAPADIARYVETRVRAYAALGLAPGDRVFVHFGNCNEFFTELLAVWRLGACLVPIDPRFTAFEIETLAEWSRPKVSAWLGAPDPELSRALTALDVKVIDAAETPGASPSALAPRRSPALDDDALILFTSGTTGQPKGVVHTHRSLRAQWTHLRDHLGLDAYERTLCLLPTHFGHGLICNSLFPWLSGRHLFIMPPFRPDSTAQLGSIIDEHEITFLSSVPALWRLALRIAKPPHHQSLRRVSVGSAPLSAGLWSDIQAWSQTAVLNAYGITETASWLAGTTVGAFTPEDGLVGVAWGGVIRVLKTRDSAAPLDAGTSCAPGESGHVWVCTPALMRGYLDRPDLTMQVVSAGWFSTGDIGVIDDRGWLFLRGRERDEINKGGMKVYPADIDAVVERFPAAMDVCAFPFSDALMGEDVGVAVVLDPPGDATLLDLHRWVSRHLARHQVPQRWYVVDEIPRTSRGKVNRNTVAERCAATEPVDMSRILRAAPDGSNPSPR
jgi:acyl-CoA synthetase (AMP-forming)/AMP-acid ligase II